MPILRLLISSLSRGFIFTNVIVNVKFRPPLFYFLHWAGVTVWANSKSPLCVSLDGGAAGAGAWCWFHCQKKPLRLGCGVERWARGWRRWNQGRIEHKHSDPHKKLQNAGIDTTWKDRSGLFYSSIICLCALHLCCGDSMKLGQNIPHWGKKLPATFLKKDLN